MMEQPNPYRTKSGRVLTQRELDALVEEAERGYDVDELARRPGRPRLGSAPALVVPVRLHSQLAMAVTRQAAIEKTSVSDLVRRALDAYLGAEPPTLGAMRTQTGRILSESELDALASEAEVGYDLETLQSRPARSRAQAEVVLVRLPPELKAAVDQRAEFEATSVSEIIRAALRVAAWRIGSPGAGTGRPGIPSTVTKDVRAAVEKELGFDPLVDSADITVRNINGDVTLTGTVTSYPQYLEAAAAARRVAGVTNVHNHLEVVLPEGDYRDDVQLATAANNTLGQNVTVPDGVEATADDGNITLTGTVSYGTERAAAEAAVVGLAGVRNVRNDIDISYVINPVDVDLHVQEALDRSALVPDASDVTVDTKDGIITLTGHVRTWAEHDAMVNTAWMAAGVIDVRDNLQVTG